MKKSILVTVHFFSDDKPTILLLKETKQNQIAQPKLFLNCGHQLRQNGQQDFKSDQKF